MSLFALANAELTLSLAGIGNSIALAAFAGFVLGKPPRCSGFELTDAARGHRHSPSGPYRAGLAASSLLVLVPAQSVWETFRK
ncbi:hypothetical protein AAFN46_00385 [Pseudomonas sp. CAU 1711]|uniref:hypothetical protein n=1 Tax=Pseudomonas sp. CAU 1711 TaxID=3140356 RepID=UPI00326148DA